MTYQLPTTYIILCGLKSLRLILPPKRPEAAPVNQQETQKTPLKTNQAEFKGVLNTLFDGETDTSPVILKTADQQLDI